MEGAGYSATDPVTSPTIDAGDPLEDYSAEPAPDGGVVNQGSYGNRGQASLSAPPPGPPQFGALYLSSAAVAYGTVVSEGYRVEASSRSDFQAGTVISSQTDNPGLGVLAPQGLDPNTTYYFRVAGSYGGGYRYAPAALSSSTLALSPVRLDSDYLVVHLDSAALRWAAFPLVPPESSSRSCQGYLLEASSTDFGVAFPGGEILSSATPSVLLSTLTVPGLDLATTYYFRVGSLNHNSVPNYSALQRLNVQISTSSSGLSFGTLDAALHTSTVSVSSVVVTNVGSIPVTLLVWGSTTTPDTPWALGTAPEEDVVLLEGLWNSEQPVPGAFNTPITVSTRSSAGGNYAGDQDGSSVQPGESVTLWFKLSRPTVTTTVDRQDFAVYLKPSFP